MKTDDIFEAITDIDDRFIAEARPTDLTGDQMAIAYPAVKKPVWRTLVPVAACVTALAAAGAFGVKYFGGRGVQPSNSAVSSPASLKEIVYPDEAKYIVDKEITRFNFVYGVAPGTTLSIYDSTADYAQSYDELAAQSDLIVVGTFIDFLHQTQDFEEIFHSGDSYMSYNSLEVDRVLKGNVEEKDILTICQNSSISAGTDIVYNFFVGDQLSPMLKGDKWIYFLKKDENGIYSPVNGPQGRYPLPGYTNTFITCDGIVATVDKFGAHANAAPARDEIYDTLLKLLNLDLTAITVPSDSSRNDFQMEEFPNYEFAATHKGILVNSIDMNALDVSITSGDSVENLYLCDLNGDGKRELCATVLNGGVKSVEVVDIAKDKLYTLQGNRYNEYYLGRKGEALMLVEAEQRGSDRLVASTQLSLDMMTPILSNNVTAVTKIDAEKKFKLAEFPDKTFEITKYNIVMSDITTPDAMIRPVISGMEYYLTDLNGDGKREICCWGSIGSGVVSFYITVYDIANDEFYFKNTEVMKTIVSLDVKDGVLYAVTSEYIDDKEISREPLSLDILEKVTRSDTAYEEVPLYVDQMFTMDDFPGFSFTVDTTYDYTQFSFGWGSSSVSNHVTGVYLYDIDGDGKREIAMNCPFVGNGCIRVYGFMDNGELGCAEYYEDNGCWLSRAEDDTLKYYTNNKIETFKFSKSDLKPAFARNYSYQLLGWDHTLDFTEILPSLGAYEVTINNRTLKIKHGGEQIFDSGISLKDLYSIPDKENNSVVLIYIPENVGGDDCMVGAVKLSEKSAERYDFEEGISIKPTTDELLFVKADGSEEPFRFPKDSVSLLQ